MTGLKQLLVNSHKWAKEKKAQDPNFFTNLAKKQNPNYLWIGCADSRVPANEIVGLDAGELFVHRNVANLFPHSDINCLSVLQFGLEVLEIEEVIVCGHYGCGGVAAAMEPAQSGLVDNWIRYVRDIYFREREQLNTILDPQEKFRKLVELNTIYQVMNVCHTTVVQNLWAKGKRVIVHGCVYDLETGLLKDLDCSVSSLKQVDKKYHTLKLI